MLHQKKSRLPDTNFFPKHVYEEALSSDPISATILLFICSNVTIYHSPTKNPSPVTMLLLRQFPLSGFEVINPSQKVEEEQLPFYNHDDYYPVQIGAVIVGFTRVATH